MSPEILATTVSNDHAENVVISVSWNHSFEKEMGLFWLPNLFSNPGIDSENVEATKNQPQIFSQNECRG